LIFLQRRTEDLSDVPLKNITIKCAVNDEGGLWSRQTQRADQRLIFPVISRDLIDGTLMTRCTAIPTSHRDVEATLVQKDKSVWLLKVRCEVTLELRTQFLTAFSGDQRFFYG